MQKPYFFPFQKLGLTLLLFLVTTALYSQSPLGIPYQAVLRNADGSVMSNAAVNMIFKIHDGSASGNVVYEESHALTSNAQGLVSCVVGNGIVSQGNFGNIPWGSGAKFLQVMMGTTELGTQQMMSVPYAMYSNGVDVRVSSVGDTLVIGGQSVIVPGISAANVSNNGMPTSGLGAVVLPGNATCADQFISVSGCNGQTTLTYDGRIYDLVEIGGQCWFADNLATDQYRNGDLIPSVLDNPDWVNITNGVQANYNFSQVTDITYGKLYNWYTTIDSRGLCPSGWHVPTDCEWMYLEDFVGMSESNQESAGWRGNEGGALKSITMWEAPNSGSSNSSGFEGLPGGYLGNGNYFDIGSYGYWWSSSENNSSEAWNRVLAYGYTGIARAGYNKVNVFNIRCLRDEINSQTLGCTDASACNFLVNANQDDGSCLYVNATCDDGNANTINDVIGSDCQCAGTLASTGALGSQVLPGNNTCANEYISVTGCGGQASLTYDGLTYDLVEIGGQCWFADNLATDQYRNGDLIPTGLDNTTWKNTTAGAYAIYNNDPANDVIYGKLYNWYTTQDTRGLCPTGWHVPTDCEWMYLEGSLGMSLAEQQSFFLTTGRGLAQGIGTVLKSQINWNTPGFEGTNLTGFTALPGGSRNLGGGYQDIGRYGHWWTSNQPDLNDELPYRQMAYDVVGVNRASVNRRILGFSVRCLKD